MSKPTKSPKAPKVSKTLSSMSQTHGEVVNPKPRTLDELLGKNKMQNYAYGTEGEYITYLNTLNTADIEKEAQKFHLIPCVSRAQLITKLISIYRSTKYSEPPVNVASTPPDEDRAAKVKAILNRF